MTVHAPATPATSAGISPAELALMRQAAARLSRAPAASGTDSAPDPYAALTLPFTPGLFSDPEPVFWVKPEQPGQSHYCI